MAEMEIETYEIEDESINQIKQDTYNDNVDILKNYESFDFYLAMQKFLSFCSEDLGGFYLDVLKDRLYTTQEDSKARRSAQTALFHITQSLIRIMAPILSFTAEELWHVVNKENTKTIFVEN